MFLRNVQFDAVPRDRHSALEDHVEPVQRRIRLMIMRPGPYRTSFAIDAIRDNCSALRFFSRSTASSAITFSMMFSSAMDI